jgi:hypothetical protein
VYTQPRSLSPRAAVMLGLAGIMVALAVITAAHASTAPPAALPIVHASATPATSPTGG